MATDALGPVFESVIGALSFRRSTEKVWLELSMFRPPPLRILTEATLAKFWLTAAVWIVPLARTNCARLTRRAPAKVCEATLSVRTFAGKVPVTVSVALLVPVMLPE